MVETISGIIGSLGGPVLVAIVMIILGLIFRAGISASIRGGLYTGIGLAGLFVIVNNALMLAREFVTLVVMRVANQKKSNTLMAMIARGV